jgi:hypothetical protein
MLTCTFILLLTTIAAQPQGWWRDTKGLLVESAEQLDSLMDLNQDKFIMLDFYMEQCHWCFVF